MTDFIEQFFNEASALQIDNAEVVPIYLADGDTLTGTLGGIYPRNDDFVAVDQDDEVFLTTTVGQSYTVTVSGYNDQ